MPRRADILVAQTSQPGDAGTRYIVQTPAGVLYLIYSDSGIDVAFKKSTDRGLTWNQPVIVFAGTVTNLSLWYDRWSNIAADLIHIAYTEGTGSDTLYRTIDAASSDALSTQTTIFLGTSRATGGHLSIARAVGGNVYCKTVIDAGAEGGFYRLPTANVPNGAWDAARTVDEAIATNDKMILLPDYDAADTQDMLAIFWDTSASEVSRKLYDDSANSWAETSIATSMTSLAAATAFPHFDVAVDIANTRHWLVAWSNVDAASAKLRCWKVDAGAITEVTNVVSSSTDDQGLAAITRNNVTGELTVFYAGATDGSETCWTALNVYMKGSRDDGVTWGPETKVTAMATAQPIPWLAAIPMMYDGAPPVAWVDLATIQLLMINVDVTQPHAGYQLGV